MPGESRRVRDVAASEFAMREHYAFCAGVSFEERLESDAWLESAASAGYLLAMRELAHDLRLAPARALEMQELLWSAYGDMAALSSLALSYRRGWGRGGEPDYVRAYAFQFANLKLHEAAFAGSGHPTHRNMLQGMEGSLTNTASYLTPEQTADAAAFGRRLLRENPNCCVSRLFGEVY